MRCFLFRLPGYMDLDSVTREMDTIHVTGYINHVYIIKMYESYKTLSLFFWEYGKFYYHLTQYISEFLLESLGKAPLLFQCVKNNNPKAWLNLFCYPTQVCSLGWTCCICHSWYQRQAGAVAVIGLGKDTHAEGVQLSSIYCDKSKTCVLLNWQCFSERINSK